MGYGLYWEYGRWQGYGVPAYCDYPGCHEEVDRGLGYRHEEDQEMPPQVFCCAKHSNTPLDSFEVESKEHPEWLRWVLTHDSWEQWRQENPETVREYREMLEAQGERITELGV